IPLSPTTIILPRETESLPPLLRRHALGLVGLGYSLATAPPALLEGRPRTDVEQIDRRVYQLAQAARYLALGEDPFEALAPLAAAAAGGTAEGALERWAEVTFDLGPMSAVLAEGAETWITVTSRTSGKRLRGSGIEADRLRELPWGDLYDLGSSELAVVSRSE